VHDPHVAVGQQIGREALLVGQVAVEDPAQMRVPEPAGQGGR
jgi:hypothetical protein